MSDGKATQGDALRSLSAAGEVVFAEMRDAVSAVVADIESIEGRKVYVVVDAHIAYLREDGETVRVSLSNGFGYTPGTGDPDNLPRPADEHTSVGQGEHNLKSPANRIDESHDPG